MRHRSRISPQEDERIPSVSKGKNGSDGGDAPPGCPTIFLIRQGAARLLWNKSDGDQWQAVFDPLEPRRTEVHEGGRKLRIPCCYLEKTVGRGKGVTAFAVLLILSSPPPKSGAKLRVSFCAVAEMSV